MTQKTYAAERTRAAVQLRLQARGRSACGGANGTMQETCSVEETCSVVELRGQVRGRSARGGRRKRLVAQLRLQARGRSARGGLAGRSRACKHCSGLALP